MAKKELTHINRIRGNTQTCDNYTGVDGEFIINRDTQSIRIHDNKKKGGYGTIDAMHYPDALPEQVPTDLRTGAHVTVGNGRLDGGQNTTATSLAGDGLKAEGGKLVVNAPAIDGVVHTTGNETVGGVKTFSSSPVVPTATAGDKTTKAASTAFVDAAIDANDANVVHKAGTEEVSGQKIFTSVPVVRGTGPSYSTMINDIDRTVQPTTLKTTSPVFVRDKNGATLGGLYCRQDTNWHNRFGLYTTNKSGTSSYLYIGVRNTDDVVYTSAPTPPLADKTTQIATTEWVKNILPSKNGFVVNSDGTISVDFSALDEATLKKIRTELGVKTPLATKGNAIVYIDGNTGADNTDEGRGFSSNKPFKTIQYAIDYICLNYSLGLYSCYFYITGGITYEEAIVLRNYDTAGGIMNLQSTTGARATIKYPASRANVSSLITLNNSSSWNIYNIDLDALDIDVSLAPSTWTSFGYQTVSVANSGKLSFSGCSFAISTKNSVKQGQTLTGVRVFYANGDGSTISLLAAQSSATGQTVNKITHIVPGTPTGTFWGIVLLTSGADMTVSQNDVSQDYSTYSIDSNGSLFLANSNGVFSASGTGRYMPKFIPTGSRTIAKKYNVYDGGIVKSNGNGVDWFPGTQAGTVEASTFSWYK